MTLSIDRVQAPGDAGSPRERDGDLVAHAYRCIREAIVDQKHLPGDPLRVSALAEWLGVSRTPVREALRRLQGEGFIALSPPRGFVVAQISAEDVENAYLVVELLEGLGARMAAARVTPEGAAALRRLVAELEDSQRSGDLDAWMRADAAFHDTIREIAAIPILNQVSATVFAVVARVRHMQMREQRDPAFNASVIAAHSAVAEAIIAGDGERAEAQMRQILAIARIDSVRLLRQWVVPLRRSF